MTMEVKETRQDEVTIFTITGEIDTITSYELEKQLIDHIHSGARYLALDLGGVEYISSAGLRVLLKTIKELKLINGRMFLCSIRNEIKEVFVISGFNLVFPIYHTLEEGLTAGFKG